MENTDPDPFDALRDAALDAFDTIGVAMAETDRDLRACRMNRRAQTLLARSTHVQVHCMRVRFCNQSLRVRLLEAVTSAWRTDAALVVHLAADHNGPMAIRVQPATYTHMNADLKVLRLHFIEHTFAVGTDAFVAWQACWRLTPRECDVGAALIRGANQRDISQSLNLSVDGVKYHMKGLLAKTGSTGRADLAARLAAVAAQVRRQ